MTASQFICSPAGYHVGDKAKDLNLKTWTARWFQWLIIKRKGFIVVFTCNIARLQKLYEGRIMDLDKKYASKGFLYCHQSEYPNIEAEDSFDNMVRVRKERSITFPYLFDETRKMLWRMALRVRLNVYVLSKKGNDMTVEYIGAIDDNADDATRRKRIC